MFEHEYNPVHVHQGTLFTGLSSVMILKLPKSFGVEYSSPDTPQNGRLQILGSSGGQFSNIDYQPKIKERDFYIFPYDMRHCVYPFNGPGWRRTLAANMDVQYDPIKNRGVDKNHKQHRLVWVNQVVEQILKKELLQLVGFHLKKWDICIKT